METGIKLRTENIAPNEIRKSDKSGHAEHQRAADSAMRSDDPENVSDDVRGSIGDFDGSYAKAQQLLAMLENSNKDTGRTSASTRSNITASQLTTPGFSVKGARFGNGGAGESEGVSVHLKRDATHRDNMFNPEQTPDGSATVTDSLSNSRYGSEAHDDGDGDAGRRIKGEKENSNTTRKEEKERSIDEERERTGGRERVIKREREKERENLRMDLAECRVRIEDRRNIAMVSVLYYSCLSFLYFRLFFHHLRHHHFMIISVFIL